MGFVIVLVVLVVLVVLAALALRRRDNETLTFPGPITGLDVRLPAGGLRVQGSTDDAATITREVRWLLRKPRLEEVVEDGVIRLRAEGSPLTSGIAEYTVRLPAAASVTAWSSAGQIVVRGTTGGVDARSSAGGINLEDVGGPLKLTTSAGFIFGERLVSADVEAHTAAGGVELEFSAAPERVSIETGAGSVELCLPDDRYAVDASNEVGATDVDVTTDDAAARKVSVRTQAGSIRIRRP